MLIIVVDVVIKVLNVFLGFIDRFSGLVVILGDVSFVELVLNDVLEVLGNMLNFLFIKIIRI